MACSLRAKFSHARPWTQKRTNITIIIIITDSSIEAVLMHTPTPAYICVDLHKPPNLPNSTGMGEVPDTGPVSLAVPV